MNNNHEPDLDPSSTSAPSLTMADAYHVIFRRKWFVITGLVLGLAGAVALCVIKAPKYESTAKLMVSYVRDSRAPSLDPTQVTKSSAGSVNPLVSEAEILGSLDVAREAAEAVGPGRILPKGEGTNATVAAFFVKGNVKVETSPQGDVITIHSQHEAPDVASDILDKLILCYMAKHDKVHNAFGGTVNDLIQQSEQYRVAITNLDLEIKTLKGSVAISSTEDFKKSNLAEESKLRLELFNAEADLAEARATVQDLRRSSGDPTPSPQAPASASVTNTQVNKDSTPTPAGQTAQPAQSRDSQLREYTTLLARIEQMEAQLADILARVTLEAPVASAQKDRLDQAKLRKAEMEKANPSLVTAARPTPVTPFPGIGPNNIGMDLNTRAAQIPGLQARCIALSNQLAEVQLKARQVEEVEPRLTKLQKERDRLEANLTALDNAIQQRKISQAVGSANIQIVQHPSLPLRDFMKLYKMMAVAVAGGLGMGIAFAFLWELVLDRTVRRRQDLETLAGVPMFLSIPDLPLPKRAKELPKISAGTLEPLDFGSTNGGTDAPEPDGLLQPFHEALRDRLVNHFEVRQMTHKPKMISVTSCDAGAGVSSVAVGLAASLSEIGEGNVLLVDMREAGSAHAFFQGRPACGLMEALEDEARTQAQVQDKLYVVSGSSSDRSFERVAPRHFGEFVPKLKASDYEYIIFDMPPVSQTSVTAKVARFMDMVLLVTEAGKTSREVATQAVALLAESKATVATVLNKRRRYIPRWLLQELD